MSETLVIDRAKWYRGMGSTESRLVRPQDHLMCCLGFCLSQRGFEEKELLDVGTPAEVASIAREEIEAVVRLKGLVEWCENEVNTYETHVCDQLVDVNDNPNMDEPTREKCITALFAEISVAVEFIN